MEVVERKPVPIYEVKCEECGSRIRYRKADVFTCHITCPVCGVSLWANTINPVRYVDRAEQICNPHIIKTEGVYGQYTDTAGNYHWFGTRSGEHVIKEEEDE